MKEKFCSNCTSSFHPNFRIRSTVYGIYCELCTVACLQEIKVRWNSSNRTKRGWGGVVYSVICLIILLIVQ